MSNKHAMLAQASFKLMTFSSKSGEGTTGVVVAGKEGTLKGKVDAVKASNVPPVVGGMATVEGGSEGVMSVEGGVAPGKTEVKDSVFFRVGGLGEDQCQEEEALVGNPLGDQEEHAWALFNKRRANEVAVGRRWTAMRNALYPGETTPDRDIFGVRYKDTVEPFVKADNLEDYTVNWPDYQSVLRSIGTERAQVKAPGVFAGTRPTSSGVQSGREAYREDRDGLQSLMSDQAPGVPAVGVVRTPKGHARSPLKSVVWKGPRLHMKSMARTLAQGESVVNPFTAVGRGGRAGVPHTGRTPGERRLVIVGRGPWFPLIDVRMSQGGIMIPLPMAYHDGGEPLARRAPTREEVQKANANLPYKSSVYAHGSNEGLAMAQLTGKAPDGSARCWEWKYGGKRMHIKYRKKRGVRRAKRLRSQATVNRVRQAMKAQAYKKRSGEEIMGPTARVLPPLSGPVPREQREAAHRVLLPLLQNPVEGSRFSINPLGAGGVGGTLEERVYYSTLVSGNMAQTPRTFTENYMKLLRKRMRRVPGWSWPAMASLGSVLQGKQSTYNKFRETRQESFPLDPNRPYWHRKNRWTMK